ncbi:CHAP domain-containing protein [Actinokineospora globicatena]|uniref:CHAP domain-containing protein n=1 Tax=Actinokineospora globicatena TaxID=103729 RepID=UPI0020A4D6B2|nr:CHAP domain-containing protein [Actinokineospora globicatena]MCP2303838.1 CHAP domain-containing protein [Actinokineospora globicatena]GLW79007.1 hypothetical protein Aglo01_34890 [Actinokineospora globicatena]GLW86582.1 hypothetical protein Aglo02_42210 [Actinokineospora globicatena]
MSLVTRVLVVAATVASIGVGVIGAAEASPNPGTRIGVHTTTEVASAEQLQAAALREKIVKIAQRELAATSHNKEVGTNCNYYSGKIGSGTKCANGWRAEAWCADFLEFVWKEAGVNVSGITPAAASLYSYGKAHRTWNSGSSTTGVKPGDAVVYNLNANGTWASHVGIVTKVSGGKITVISGNSGPKTDRVHELPLGKPSGTVSGYTAPVA